MLLKLTNATEVELLCLEIDQKLKFDAHVDKLCKATRFKFHTLRKIRKFVTNKPAKVSANSFVNS